MTSVSEAPLSAGDVEIQELKQRLLDTEKAMEHIMAHMASLGQVMPPVVPNGDEKKGEEVVQAAAATAEAKTDDDNKVSNPVLSNGVARKKNFSVTKRFDKTDFRPLIQLKQRSKFRRSISEFLSA